MRTVPVGWEERCFSAERFWVRRNADVWYAFGLGPSLGEGVAPNRLRTVLKSSGRGVNALRYGDQIHSPVIASLAPESNRPFSGIGSVGRCDGLITDVPGLGVAVWTADCVPVLMAGGGVVAAVHAGWRGTAAGIVRRAIRRFDVEYGVPSNQVETVLGPAVSSCHYEVGDEVLSALAQEGLEEESWRRGRRVDLRDFIHLQLVKLGVDEASIHRLGPCTACDSELASYRRDGDEAGRQVSIVALLESRRPLS